jgi:murein DD-endopeptidase MepM/ murein hydrolase activator NlpD
VRIYLDLFQTTSDSTEPFEHRATAIPLPITDSAAAILGLDHEADRDGTYVLRLQPELLRRGRFELTVATGPSLAFPVEGRGNDAIQSYFGVARDGGARQHAGIDIFAPRGTPVLAATAATVRSTTPNNLGGTVVWLTDQARNQSLYYAHLDSQIVSPGQRVMIGDTIGFVGNTGNARTTPPHLHFGIYRRGRGAVDPLSHVRFTDTTPAAIVADTTLLGAAVTTRLATINLRSAPTTASTVRQQLSQDEPLRVMGAQGDWLRVQLDDGTSGYLVGRAVTRTSPRPR